MSKSHRHLCVSFSRTGAGLCIYHVLAWSNLNFFHISQEITLPILSCLTLYSCANLLHSLIMWLMVSILSPHSLHLLFCCVLSILGLIRLVLMANIGRDSVSHLKYPFLSYAQVLSWEMLFSSRLKRPYYYYYYLLITVFHISVSWWSFTGFWVTASLIRCSGLVSEFWLFSATLSFE